MAATILRQEISRECTRKNANGFDSCPFAQFAAKYLFVRLETPRFASGFQKKLVPDRHHFHRRYLAIPVCGNVLQRETEIPRLAWSKRCAINQSVVNV